MRGIDKLGLLNEITGCISVDMGVNITEIHLGGKDGVFEGYIAMEVRDRKVLETMIADLGKIDGISDVVRTDI